MPIPADILAELLGDKHANATQQPKRGEEIFDGTDYPRSWDGFIGQDRAKEELRVSALSAKARGVRLDHTMLATGIHGVGKSTLATLVAAEAEVGLLQTSGPLTIDEARDLLMSCEDRDILFIDEAHALVTGGANKIDWMLPFMTVGKLYGPRGAEPMPDVTIVAATTDAGKLPETLLSRFMCTPELVPYSPAEGAAIAANLVDRMSVDVSLTAEHYSEIARAADNNPRAMRKIIGKVRDLAYAYPASVPNLIKAFAFAGVSADGLTVTAREILVLLLVTAEHTMSQDGLRAQLGEPGPLKHHEKQLMQRGLLDVTGRGRKLSDQGLVRAVQAARELQSAA